MIPGRQENGGHGGPPHEQRVSPRSTPFLDLTIRTRPVRRVLRVRTVQRLPRPFPDDQVTALLGSLHDPRGPSSWLGGRSCGPPSLGSTSPRFRW